MHEGMLGKLLIYGYFLSMRVWREKGVSVLPSECKCMSRPGKFQGKDNMKYFVAMVKTNLCLDIMCWPASLRILINIIIYRCRYFLISTASHNTSEIAVYTLIQWGCTHIGLTVLLLIWDSKLSISVLSLETVFLHWQEGSCATVCDWYLPFFLIKTWKHNY